MPDSSNIDPQVHGAIIRERHFRDAEGLEWHVFEQPFADYDRRAGMSLIFASDIAVRRVRNFPPDWTTLTDQELIQLSWKS